MSRELGRITPPNFDHMDKYQLRAAVGPVASVVPDKGSPIFAGTNWYEGMFEPVWDEKGKFWRLREDNLGALVGGHAYLYKPVHLTDSAAWWAYHNQLNTSKCVAFTTIRGGALLNRKRYDPDSVYKLAQEVYDQWPGSDYDGTSMSAGLDVMRLDGLIRVRGGKLSPAGFDPAEGIERNRWTLDVVDMAQAMHSEIYLSLGRFPMLNSWGNHGRREGTRWVGLGWPHIVWVPLELVHRLGQEQGEYGVVTDR
jgi:hypothetical protein